MHPFRGAGSRRSYALPLIALVALLSGCAGENLFQSIVGAGTGGPTLSITAPSEGLTLAAGAAVQVSADATAQNGLVSAVYTGTYVDNGVVAFVPETETFANVPFASLTQLLTAAAIQPPGDVYIIVTITDGQGEAKADTVTVKIN